VRDPGQPLRVLMAAAAAVRNPVWVAPGQDAQFLHRSAAAAPPPADEPGQVLCRTGDAVPGTSSFHDYNLVGLVSAL